MFDFTDVCILNQSKLSQKTSHKSDQYKGKIRKKKKKKYKEHIHTNFIKIIFLSNFSGIFDILNGSIKLQWQKSQSSAVTWLKSIIINIKINLKLDAKRKVTKFLKLIPSYPAKFISNCFRIYSFYCNEKIFPNFSL